MATQDEPFRTTVPGELVVDLEHLGLIETELAALDVDHSVKETHELLGLALLSGFGESEAALDGVLHELRRRFSGRFGGWFPELGKQRVADLVRPAGPKPMSEGLPEPADPVVIPTPEAGGPTVRVGVVDTPVYHHESLPEEWVTADEWGTGVPDVPRAGHGTFVTSLIRQGAPRAHVSVRGALKGRENTADAWDAAVAIVELGQRVDVLNLSFAAYTEDGEAPLVIRRAIERVPSGVLVVAAAGNHGDVIGLVRGRTSRSPSYPAAMPRVVAVGSSGLIGSTGGKVEPGSATLSEFTPKLPWVDRTTRGVAVTGAVPGGWATWSGTSFAAARVTGLVADQMATAGVSAADALELIESLVPVFEWTGEA